MILNFRADLIPVTSFPFCYNYEKLISFKTKNIQNNLNLNDVP